MSIFVRCFLGPRLHKLYRRGDDQGRDYHGNFLESFSDGIIKTAMFSISMAWSLGFYTYPLITIWMYRRGYFAAEYAHNLGRLAGAISIVLFSTFCVRGFGRMMNNDYIHFLSVLDAYKKSATQNLKTEVSRYDFDFREWPIDFRYNDSVVDTSKTRKYIEKRPSRRNNNMIDKLQSLPCGIVSYFAIHTFGRRMIYPGSVKLIHILLSPVLMKGRARLVEQPFAMKTKKKSSVLDFLLRKFNGERFKLLTRDGNEIDSMFIDRRKRGNYPNGKTLVICCEGNSGFYEYGITMTPIEAGYSVLGWNHPGFYDSTGVPYPDQEVNAIDIVMQFALYKLGFKPNNILIYAWSIGGFSASWAAMNYPDIKGLVLDATFDDLVPLAIARMPPSWKSLVVRTVRDYMDLNNAEQLCQYNGPVLLYRRTRDEMISTRPSRSIQTNRGNDLLIRLFECRFPNLVTEQTIWALLEWLSGDKSHQTVLWTQQGVEEDICKATIMSYVGEHSPHYPMNIGDGMSNDTKVHLILYLAQKHMIDFESTHCVPLPARMFQLPWDPFNMHDNHCDMLEDSCD